MAQTKEKEDAYRAEYLKRTKLRKEKRKTKRKQNKLYNHNNATWYEGDKCMQNCEMGGSCEFPCNGDC